MKENNNLSLPDLSDSAILRENESLLSLLLKDHTTGKNIKWGTDSYINHGYSFRDDQEIKINLITGWYEGFIRPRIDKDIDIQLERQRNKAEVFTPSWVIKLQVDAALEDMEELSLVDFIKTKWLEITCGEAPYMVNRYDMETGEVIPLKERSGFIDVKFKKLNQEIESEEEWMKLAFEIYKASYGYEYQGDSLLLARENLILTFIDNYFYMFGAFPKEKLLLEITKITSLNVFQMDGLTYEVPFSDGGTGGLGTQLSLFEEIEAEENTTPKLANIKLWEIDKTIEFKLLSERNDTEMKFDVVIGNPPYQKHVEDENKEFAPPIYHFFIDAAQSIADRAILIHPARFLFNAGSTPKSWNEKILNSSNFQVLKFEQKSNEIFPNTDIKGGVAITYYDSLKIMDPIKVFTPYDELRTIMKKVNSGGENLSNIIYTQNRFDLVQLYKDYPEIKNNIGSNGKDKRFRNNIFTKISVFSEERKHDSDIPVIGLIKNKRVWRYIAKEYIDQQHENLNKYKVLVPSANGTGILGETLSTPLVAEPYEGYTQTFIGIGVFDTKTEAEAALKYIKTKFARVMLGILKITQHNDRDKWLEVPLQDFTSNSDINWNKDIIEIDQELYKKYNLSQEEIDFIEANMKEME
ncbi:Eco57I restriction-modification methylase domain-containing protein [Alkalibacterium olivapovliticus]|uniref:Type II restriction enzyme n=1 Tax=Alkalibacterium olivapovliticus TaxID=99907 RepID=A0A2T0W420_9LACT|nr:Eco57I restriction-modification methylase domain-containing protein [Alkalibacterium olivapovliticus]PRY80131.1 type II restriction enzyme [Alkalibacterium olivapovliticus]